jgi:Ca2+/H+ antiporter
MSWYKNISMSELRRKRQEANATGEGARTTRIGRKILIAVLIVAALALTMYLVKRPRVSRLDAFAKCLAARQVKMYGLYWCTHCEEQKEMFGSAFQYVPYIECGAKGSHTEQPNCVQAGVKNFPTWQFATERHEGVLRLESLSEKSGCSLP